MLVGFSPAVYTGISGYKTTYNCYNQKQISFGYDSPIKNIAKHCAYCGGIMLSSDEREQITDKILNSSGKECVDELNKVIPILQEEEKEIARRLTRLAEQFPDKKGIVLIRELVDNTSQSRDASGKAQLMIDVSKLIQKIPPKSKVRKSLEKIYESAKESQDKNEIEYLRKVKKLVNKAVSEGYNNLPEEFYEFAERPPFDRVKKFIVENGQKSEKFLLEQMFYPIAVTSEHINLASEDGLNSERNYLFVHSACNHKRNKTPFNVWIAINPGILENIKRSIIEISDKIQQGEIKKESCPEDVMNYADLVKETINSKIKGKMDISI